MLSAYRVYFRGAAVALVLGALFSAGWSVNGWRKDKQIAEMKQAAAEQIAKGWQTAEKVNRNAVEKYAEDLAAVRGRPPVVVRVCPGVPGASGGTGQPTAGVGDTGVGEDIGPTLSACLTELYRYRALSRAIQAQ